MAERLTCPSCAAALTLKNPVAPGKAIRCPKCQTTFKPEAEKPIAAASAAPRKAAPAARPSRGAEDSRPDRRERERERERERDDGEPRGRSRRREFDDEPPKKKGGLLLWTLVAVGVLVLLGGGTVGVLWGMGYFNKPKQFVGGTKPKEVHPNEKLIQGRWKVEGQDLEYQFNPTRTLALTMEGVKMSGWYRFIGDNEVEFEINAIEGINENRVILKEKFAIKSLSETEFVMHPDGGVVKTLRRPGPDPGPASKPPPSPSKPPPPSTDPGYDSPDAAMDAFVKAAVEGDVPKFKEMLGKVGDLFSFDYDVKQFLEKNSAPKLWAEQRQIRYSYVDNWIAYRTKRLPMEMTGIDKAQITVFINYDSRIGAREFAFAKKNGKWDFTTGRLTEIPRPKTLPEITPKELVSPTIPLKPLSSNSIAGMLPPSDIDEIKKELIKLKKGTITFDDEGRIAGTSDIKGVVSTSDFKQETDYSARLLLALVSPKTQNLILGAERLGDADLSKLSAAQSLEYLTIFSQEITDEGLVHLNSLSKLRRLYLRSRYITDKGLEHLKKLPNLRELELQFAPVTDAGLAHLSELSQLEELTLTGAQLEGDGFRHLAKLKSLSTLRLRGCNLRKLDLKLLGAIPRLSTLTVTGCNLRDEDLQASSEDSRIRILDLSQNHLTDKCLVQFAGMPQLEELWLDRNFISGKQLGELMKIDRLRQLSLQEMYLSDEGIEALCKLKEIPRLYVSQREGMTEEQVEKIKKAHPKVVVRKKDG